MRYVEATGFIAVYQCVDLWATRLVEMSTATWASRYKPGRVWSRRGALEEEEGRGGVRDNAAATPQPQQECQVGRVLGMEDCVYVRHYYAGGVGVITNWSGHEVTPEYKDGGV